MFDSESGKKPDTASAEAGTGASPDPGPPRPAAPRRLLQRRGAGHGFPGLQSLAELKTELKDGAEILWELCHLSEFHISTGTFEGDLDIGKAAYYCRLVHPDGVLGMLEMDAASRGSNVVHLLLDVHRRAFEMSAGTLHLNGFRSPGFSSRGCTLRGVVISGSRSSGSFAVASAVMEGAVFLHGKDRVEAADVGLAGLRTHGSYDKGAGGASAVLAALNFDEAHVRGLRYPGLPPTDVELRQAGLNFDLLCSALGPKGAAPAGGALPAGPDVAPQGSRLQLGLEGLHGAAMVSLADPGASAGAGGFDHFHARLVGADGGELAAIAVDGFHAAAAGSVSGTMDRFSARGQPYLVRHLVELQQVRAQPIVRQALDVVHACGIEPAVGGSLTLQHVGVSAAPGAASVTGDLDASFVVPDHGSLELSLKGLAVHAEPAALGGGFGRLTARFAGPDGKELAYAEIDGAAGAHAGSGDSGGVRSFVVRGDLAGLLKAADEPLKKLPPPARRALAALRQLGLKGQVSGGLQGSAAGGGAQLAGDLAFKLDAGTGGAAVAVTLKGFRGGEGGGAAAGTFTRLEAHLAARGREAAFLAIDSADGSADGSERNRGLAFHARRVELRGDAASVARLLGTIEKNAAALPPPVKRACAAARCYALAASGDVTLSDVEVGDDGHGGETARADLGARVQVAGVGELDVAVRGFEAHAQRGGARAASFDRLEATLKKKDGAEAAFFAAEGRAQEGAGAPGLSFRARRVEARGDAANLAALFGAAGTHIRQVPEQVRAAFAAVSEFGVDGHGTVSLQNVELDADRDGTRARADLDASFTLAGAGQVNVLVRGFAGSATQTAKEVHFDAFEAWLKDAGGTQAAHLLIEGKDSRGRISDGPAGAPKDLHFQAQRVQAEGSAEHLAALCGAIEQRVQALPPQVRRAFDVVKEHGAALPARAALTLTGVDLGSSGGQVVARGDLSARVAVPDVGTLEARLRGLRGGDHPGFDSLDLRLADRDGEAARLHVGGVQADADGRAARIATIQAHGDGTRLHALLDSRVLALLPPELAHPLALLDGNRLSAALDNLAVRRDAGGGLVAGADTLVNQAALHFVDAHGAVYACPDAMLMLSGARVQLGPDHRPRQIDAAAMTASGHFTARDRALQGTATLGTGSVHITVGPGGAPLQVTARDIRASGSLDLAPSPQDAPRPGRQQQLDTLRGAAPAAEEAARLIRSADVHTETPLFPGRYGRGLFHIGVASGSLLQVNVVARDNALAEGTGVRFRPPLDLPAWLTLRGVNLEARGTEGVLKTDIKGFFNFNVSRLVSGRDRVPLDIGALVRQVMDDLQRALAGAKEPASPDPDAGWLEREHGRWAADAGEHRDHAAGRSAAEQQRSADRDAAEEPRSANPLDIASPRGMDLPGTAGTADIELAAPRDTAVAGVTVPAGKDLHLHGRSAGGGQISLTADEVAVEAAGGRADAAGVSTGTVSAASDSDGTHIRFDAFSVQELRWDTLAPR